MTKSNLTTKIIAFLLALITTFTFIPMSVIAEGGGFVPTTQAAEKSEDEDKICSCGMTSVLHNGAAHKVVTLAEDGKETLELFVVGEAPTAIRWQILTPSGDRWINIYGANTSELAVTHALVGSMLNEEGVAYIRATIKHGGMTCISSPVEIKLTYNTDEPSEDSAAPMLSTFTAPRATATADSEGEGEEFEIFTVVINYIFDNGGLAFEPYGASVAKGSSFNREVESPTVVGYKPVMRVGEEYVDATTVVLDYTDIQSNITVNVIYEPTIVKYQVHHHLQDLYDDDYSVTPDYITYGEGLTGSTVPRGIELTEEALPGFKALAYELLEIAADGSTVIEIRYERNYYFVDFDMQGGYGVEPLYIRFGSEVGANIPVRHGYVFDKWELVSYGGATPSADVASRYDINSAIITVPNANLVYRAVWITQLARYTMVFWKENAEDNGFTYWGSLDSLMAMSGSTVSGSDRISEVGGIEDEAGFTYMDALTDKNVLVEGDGSTIVNVYYARNRYAITFKAPGLCSIPEGHTHDDGCYTLLCPRETHIHDESCSPVLECNKEEHTEHTDACILCGYVEHEHSSSCCPLSEHIHTTSCYRNIGAASNPSGAPTNVEDGYIFAVSTGSWWGSSYNYYIYISGTWYRYTGRNVSTGDIVNSRCGSESHTHGEGDCVCTTPEHTHVDTCYRDVLHTHDATECYSYSCSFTGHIHSSGCYVLNCAIPTGHSHSSTCTNATSESTVKIEMCKYQENLERIWPIVDDNGVSYDEGQRWSPSGSNTYGNVLVYIANMPAENFTLTLSESQYDTYTMNYYQEVLDGEPYDTEWGGKHFKLYTTVKANYNYVTEAEDFFDITGYYQLGSSPSFSNGQIDINNGGVINFYYGRIVDHELKFRSNGLVLDAATVSGIPYGASLKSYNFTPEYPASLEPGAYFFDGWYTSPGHYDGTEVNWDTLTMDEGDVMLYAKWSPTLHTVRVYLESDKAVQIGADQLVSHGSFAHAPTETVKNGEYIFQGWFYSEIKDGEIVEKAFVFTGIPVIKDLDIYAKWSSHVTVNYKINYVLFNEDESAPKVQIADPTVGSGIAGSNKTFYAKAGTDLFAAYQTGYYPLTSSHTVTMSAEYIDHEFTFEYVYVESMPYMVRYVDEAGNDIIEPKRVLENNLSVVTETFVRFDKQMPDAYQKRLVLSADGEDADGDGIYDSNVIVFNYTEDEVHAYYRVVHYIENLHGSGYREYRSEDSVGEIGSICEILPITMTGFSYNPALTTVNGVYHPTESGAVKETLTSEGLIIELYYDRVEIDYVVRYLESGTNKVLYTEKLGSGIFGEQIVEYAPGLTHIGYALVSDSVKQINLSANESLNVIEFYYVESSYSLQYEIVGAPEGATLTMTSEPIKAVSGVPTGSRPIISGGYHFDGWFLDAACTQPVPSEWVDADNHIIPENDGVWLSDLTYYAKVEADYTHLTVTTLGVADVDVGEMFIFRIKGVSDGCTDVDLKITVVGNSSVTVSHLPIGQYTVTELEGWAYRYTPDSQAKSITITYQNSLANVVTFSHVRTNVQWLDGNDNKPNTYN